MSEILLVARLGIRFLRFLFGSTQPVAVLAVTKLFFAERIIQSSVDRSEVDTTNPYERIDLDVEAVSQSTDRFGGR